MKSKDAFRILGLPERASLEQAEAAYRKLADRLNRELQDDDPAAVEVVQKAQLLKEALEVIRVKKGGAPGASNLYGQIYGQRKPKKEAPSTRQGETPSLLEETFTTRSGANRSKAWVAGITGAVALGLLLLILLPGTEPALEGQPESETEAAIRTDPASESSSSADTEEHLPDQSPKQADLPPAETDPAASIATPAPVERRTRPPQAERSDRDKPRLVREEIAGAATPSNAREIPPPQVAESQSPVPAPSSAKPEAEAAASNEPDPEAEIAFQLLKDRAEGALRLHEGLLEELDFLQWSVVSRSGSNWMIDLSAHNRETGREEHFVWSVDTERERVRALSQAARDLEGRFLRPQ
ncbi:MAG TPA: hypothetical protein VMN76_08025 [Acidobacteriota bacterium]|nr:hypothetical protein [Acidobacteriota bacterium]